MLCALISEKYKVNFFENLYYLRLNHNPEDYLLIGESINGIIAMIVYGSD